MADSSNITATLVLVHPPQEGLLEGFASGLVALANYVSGRLPSVRVQLLDLGLVADNRLEHELRDLFVSINGPLFVGITTTTASYQAALRVARTFKRMCRECVVILGGHHASSQDDVILRAQDSIDYVVRGEGEIALVHLLEQYPDVSRVPNLSYRENLTIRRNAPAPFLGERELDELAPAFKGWGLRSAPGKFEHTTYVSARGCPLRCAFCSVANERIRAKSVAAVIRDLRVLIEDFGYGSIAVEDNFFAHAPRRTLALCAAIEVLQRELPFRWDCQTRVESCQRTDVLEAMERAGCEAVYLGVESLDPLQLLYLRKTSQPGTYLKLLEAHVVPWLVRSRMDCYINLQLGLPGEGPENRERTMQRLQALGKLATERGKTITVFPQLHVVYPGTAHFHEAVRDDRFGRDGAATFERFTIWESQQKPVLKWLGEHFAHGTGGLCEGILFPDRLRRGEFEVDSHAVLNVVNYLHEMASVPGISVFKYGRYLAKVSTGVTEVAPSGGVA